MEKTNKEIIISELEYSGYRIGRLISGSKSMYRTQYPDHIVVFNANIITEEFGKIWYGDLDITLDFDRLYDIAKSNNIKFYILRELDARFGNETQDISILKNNAIAIIG